MSTTASGPQTMQEIIASIYDPTTNTIRTGADNTFNFDSITSNSSSLGGGAGLYSNIQGDFTATANSGAKTITLSAYASTVLSTGIAAGNFTAAQIYRISSAGAVDALPLTNVAFSANVLTLSGMTANFAVGDTVAVFIMGPDKAFDETNDQHKITQNTMIAGEDLTNNVLKVEQRFSYTNITTNATTTIKTGSGYLQQITINNPGKFTVADLVIAVYDNTAGSGTLIGTWTAPVAATTQVVPPITLNVSFATGLTIVTSGPTVTANLTVSYR